MSFFGAFATTVRPRFEAEGVSYRDHKRLAWSFSIAIPLFLGTAPLFYDLSGSPLTLWIPALLVYTLIPLADVWMGEDLDNPPEEVVPLLEGRSPTISGFATFWSPSFGS